MKTIRRKPMKKPDLQSGLTLIEVMVSISLGIFFLAAAMQYLVAGQLSFRSQDSGSRIQENARFSFQLIKSQVRMAGYSENPAIVPTYFFTETCGTAPINGLAPNRCTDDTTTVQGDRIAISMMSPNSEDCLGTAVSPATQIANVFWVGVTNGVSSLYCRGYNIDSDAWLGSVSQPLIDGVEQMQVQYGLVDEATGSIERYVNATAVEALDRWNDVQSVRVALLVSSGLNTDEAEVDGLTLDSAVFNDQYGSFALLDGATYTPDDNQIRRVFSSNIAVNNAL